MISRPIPSSGEELPVIGFGTWQTFDVGANGQRPLIDVLDRFAAAGGKVIDTSPMYGRAEETVGALRDRVPGAFLATKVWTRGREHGIEQMRRSMQLMRTKQVDLMQIHNLVDWRTHLATLRQWKADGVVRYIGITHYARSAFGELESIMRDVFLVPETITASELLKRFQQSHQQIAIVIDEYGGVAGLVTVEDIIEEIVGEIEDEDTGPEEIIEIIEGEDGYFDVLGSTEIDNIERLFDVDLEDEEYTTIAGLVVTEAGYVPKPGEKLQLRGLDIEVLKADEKKIHLLRLRKAEEPEPISESAA